MSDAFSEEGKDELAHCKGRWPHLRKYDEEACEGQAAGDLAGGLEQLVPDDAVGPLDPVHAPTSWVNWSSGTGPSSKSANRPAR